MHRLIRTTTARIGFALAIALALLLTAVSASAGAAGFVSLRPMKPVEAGHVVKAKARLSRPAARCRLQMRRQGGRRYGSSVAGVRRARLLFRWRVPDRVRRGAWRLRVSCRRANGRRSSDRARLRVRGSRRGRLVLVARRRPGTLVSGRLLGGRRGASPSPAPSLPAPAPRPVVPTGPRPVSGECTDWADYQRPDIMANSPGRDWDARHWNDNARAGGYPVNKSPAAGAIAVWEAYQGGAFSYGHVAYVESVAGGAVRISEMNWNGIRTPTERTLNSSQVAAAEFIHYR